MTKQKRGKKDSTRVQEEARKTTHYWPVISLSHESLVGVKTDRILLFPYPAPYFFPRFRVGYEYEFRLFEIRACDGFGSKRIKIDE